MRTILQRFGLFMLLVSFFGIHKGFAQAASWQWAKGAGSTGSDQGMSIVVDASGNVYTLGWYTSAQLTFGSITLTNPGVGTSDIFLTKHDAAGNAIWAKTFGGTDGEIGNGIAIDANGDVYITGWYASSTITFGTFTLTNSASGSDVFTVKINSSGNTVWAATGGGSNSDRGNSIAVDPSGNVFTTGSFMSATANFGTVALTNSASGTNDFLMLKYDASGNLLWAKSAGGNGTDAGNGVAVDASGNAYVTGIFASPSIDFGASSITNASSGTQDIFVVKYDASGNAIWSKQHGGSMDDQGNAIIVCNNDLYVAGGFNSATIGFGTNTLTNASAGTSDVLFTKYDLSGNVVWARAAGSVDAEVGTTIITDQNGSKVFLGGHFNGASIVFGSDQLSNSSPGYKDLFIASYDATGSWLWSTKVGDVYDEWATDMAINSQGDILVTGVFNSGSLSFGSNTLFKGCGDDVFIAKYIAPVVGLKEEHISKAITIYPNPALEKIVVADKGKITIYNALGKNVLSVNEEERLSNEIDISALPNGVYSVEVSSKQGSISKNKIVIDR